MTTRGDTHRGNFGPLDAPGVFTKELQRALLAGEADLAVHSLKDLPTDEVPGLQLAAVPPRESVRDVLCSRQGQPLVSLPQGATVATGSLRRRTQLLYERADLRLADVRGNVDTRLKKLAAGEFDALVLAHAGLVRLGLDSEISEFFEPERFLPAVGQGAGNRSPRRRPRDARCRRGAGRCRHAPGHRRGASLAGGPARRLFGADRRLGPQAGRRRFAARCGGAQRRRAFAAVVRPGSDRTRRRGPGRDVAGELLDQGAAALVAESRASR